MFHHDIRYVNTLYHGLGYSMVRVLAQYTRDPWFESKLRFDFSPPATFGIKHVTFSKLIEFGDKYWYS